MLSNRSITRDEMAADRHGRGGVAVPVDDPYNAVRLRVVVLNSLRFPIGFEMATREIRPAARQNRSAARPGKIERIGRVVVDDACFGDYLLALDNLALPEFTEQNAGRYLLSRHPAQLVEAIDRGEPAYVKHYMDRRPYYEGERTRYNLDLETILPSCFVAATERLAWRRMRSSEANTPLDDITQRQYRRLKDARIEAITPDALQGVVSDYYDYASSLSPVFASQQLSVSAPLIRQPSAQPPGWEP